MAGAMKICPISVDARLLHFTAKLDRLVSKPSVCRVEYLFPYVQKIDPPSIDAERSGVWTLLYTKQKITKEFVGMYL